MALSFADFFNTTTGSGTQYGTWITQAVVASPTDPALVGAPGSGGGPVVPPVGDITMAVNATTAAAGALDASTANVTFAIELASYIQTVTGFGAGDILDFPAGNNPTVVNTDYTDGIVDVPFALSGNTLTMHLTGLDAAIDVQLNGIADFDTVFGAGTIV